MKSKAAMFITAVTSGIVGAFVWFGISNSDAQPAGARQMQLVITGEGIVGEGREKIEVRRFEDSEYGIVCYVAGMGASCVKK